MSLVTRLTYVLPHRLLSALARSLAYSQRPWLKRRLIDAVTRRFGVDLSEAADSDPASYASFNAFFTRALRPGARVPDPDPRSLLMPADGRISQCGRIVRSGEAIGDAATTASAHGAGNGVPAPPGAEGARAALDRIFQAKGHSFSVAELLADADAARPFHGGLFATVYLSPRDYHRVHMPWTGRLRRTVHVPGRLFSVSPAAVAHVPRLFARNERLVCHFDTDFGPMALVMVGALLVSGVETVWGGVEIPRYGDRVLAKDYRDRGIVLERFAEMARFNYGSTVIVLLPPGVAELAPGLGAETPVRLGQRLALLH